MAAAVEVNTSFERKRGGCRGVVSCEGRQSGVWWWWWWREVVVRHLCVLLEAAAVLFSRLYTNTLCCADAAGKMVNWCFLPDHVLEVIFSYLAVHDLRNCSLVCKNWYRCLNDENNDVWRLHCVRKLAEEALKSDLLASVPTYKAKLRAFYHAWNPNDCSRNIYVKPNGFTLHRNPVAQSTDGARGKLGFRSGRHAWEVVWEGPLGTVAVIGIATRDAAVQCPGYVALLGSDEHSWGWNLVDNHLLHNGDSQGNYPLLNNAPKYQVGERIRVILDCDDNTLAFEKNYEFLGVAFRGLPDKQLYPSVSAVYGNTEVSMVYLGPPLDG
ncbi:F-box/SPRY domain-containing protein 1 isoform X2 [Panulirus ornatus]|uniref:F-box/SPRY domain-containing protein 1 isoform X2 n=1 Tax=Panulirus ornatus TaxID=150431 RepID=UPI003A8C76CD